MATRQELFIDNYLRRGAERQAKKYIDAFCRGMSVSDFHYAAENNLNIVSSLLKHSLLRPGEEKSGRKKAVPYRKMVEKFANADTVIRIFSEVSPEHGQVLRQHRSWLERQIRSGLADVFGD